MKENETRDMAPEMEENTLFANETPSAEAGNEAAGQKAEAKRKRRTNAEMEASRKAQEKVQAAMEKAETIRTLYESTDKAGVVALPLDVKMHRIRREISCPKNMEVNPLGNSDGWRFRTLGNIYDCLMPLLDQYGLTIDISEDIVPVEGGEVYVKATIEVIDLYAEGQKKVFHGYARETRSNGSSTTEQLTGRAMNYAKKEALSAMLCFNSSRDADEASGDATPVAAAADTPAERPAEAAERKPEVKVEDLKRESDPVPMTSSKPHLPTAGPEFEAEVKRLREWTGTREQYEADLQSRYDVMLREMIIFENKNRTEMFNAA